ncbi:acyl-CoA dehydrogenase family protein [Amycolatopsis cihanbeyliensis]|uniref:3-hydroxy-9,10-secoandrosta-1,3,5(10)-triene-9, 17-dione monooxygenase n=1 Tax=Amycolatopsis cihanbeyliensis TaxID=1128664 RepID=A0A542DQH2_AMYCI|nr:acyl-CoA dehydrogenase family protein [Amycolatopsis cihanbeyliensis]TQJ05244.1 3-hydroxy-9,10-secoandrosta-1,3,5(10)-triene-9,17-dione monooxygenase [Amycolatopsis cihanbeyliensis]
MTSTRTEPGHVRAPETGLAAEEAVARARAIASGLVERQAETEQRTYYAPDVHDQLVNAGLYRLLVPRRYGGYELGADTFARVCTALARGCPSTGWMYLFGAAHALVVGTLFEERAQRELFATGDFICPATVAPAGSATRVDGGWVVNGTWRYCSGSPYATHFLGHTMVHRDGDPEPTPLMFVLPRESWRLEDDWGGQLGLRGSGSHGITAVEAHVPDHLTRTGLLPQTDPTKGTPGRALHTNPEYGGGPLSFMLLELGILAVGMAQGALDAYDELMRARTTSFWPIVPRTEDPDYQFRYGEAAGMIAAAEAAVLDAVRQWRDLSARGPAAITRERELRLALIGRETVRLCWRAVESQLFPTAGSSSVRAGERVERVWRDMSMLHSHAGLGTFLSSMANRELAQAHFFADQA